MKLNFVSGPAKQGKYVKFPPCRNVLPVISASKALTQVGDIKSRVRCEVLLHFLAHSLPLTACGSIQEAEPTFCVQGWPPVDSLD